MKTRGIKKILRELQKRYQAAAFADGWALEIGSANLVNKATGETVGPFELRGEVVIVLLTPMQALALLDATAAAMDDRGNVSKKWFPAAVARGDCEKAVQILRPAIPFP